MWKSSKPATVPELVTQANITMGGGHSVYIYTNMTTRMILSKLTDIHSYSYSHLLAI